MTGLWSEGRIPSRFSQMDVILVRILSTVEDVKEGSECEPDAKNLKNRIR
jgi:hypothetical protein